MHVEYADQEPYNATNARPMQEKARPLSRFLALAPGEGKNSLQQRIDRKRRGIGRQRYPFVGEYMVTHVQLLCNFTSHTSFRSMDVRSCHAWHPNI